MGFVETECEGQRGPRRIVAEGRKEPNRPLGLAASTVVAAHAKLAGDVLASFRIVPVQWAILEQCDPAQGTTATLLARAIPIDSASISRNVERLVRLGLLQRQRVERDRRIVRLTLTDEARAIFPEIVQRMQAVDSALLEGVTAGELEGFLRTVHKVTANAARYSELADPGDSG